MHLFGPGTRASLHSVRLPGSDGETRPAEGINTRFQRSMYGAQGESQTEECQIELFSHFAESRGAGMVALGIRRCSNFSPHLCDFYSHGY
jgi:hypothetical protein